MNPSLPYFFGFCGGFTIAVVVFFLYERQNKQLRSFLEFTQKQLNACLSKMMAVDYEKLAEADIAARSLAHAAWRGDDNVVLPEMGDLDMYNPEDYKVDANAK